MEFIYVICTNHCAYCCHLLIYIMCIDAQRSGLVKDYQALELTTMANSEVFNSTIRDAYQANSNNKDVNQYKRVNGSTAVVGSKNNNMTDQHHLQLQQIRETDLRIDEEIMKIGEGIDVLHEIAAKANEEVKLQNVILTSMFDYLLVLFVFVCMYEHVYLNYVM